MSIGELVLEHGPADRWDSAVIDQAIRAIALQGYEQLQLFGMTPTAIAKATGRPAVVVKERLRLNTDTWAELKWKHERVKAVAGVVAGVRAWCASNEVREPPLDWEGLGEFLTRVTPPAVSPESGGGS